ncbi:TPA: DNA phosphorothioation-dependent restriction protein DptH, partial [Enterobacter cloacae]
MSKEHFENFLACSFYEFFCERKFRDSKFHYVCPNNKHAFNLFRGFESLGFKEIVLKGALIKYITINDQNVLIMLHDCNGCLPYTYHEDFIATIRDELNSHPGFSLLIIHNSTLDTILTTSSDLSSSGFVFTNEYIEDKLLSKIPDGNLLLKLLTKRRSHIINVENGSIFSFENIHACINNERLDLTKEGLFNDDRLYDVNNEKDLLGSIKENEKLFNDIAKIVNDYDDVNIKDKLEEVNLSESFIKEHFPKDNLDKWRELTFSEVQQEVEKNKSRILEFLAVQVNGIDCNTFKHMSDKGVGNKSISLLAEVDDANGCVEIKLIFSKGSPPLSKDDFRQLKNCSVNIHNSEHKSSALLRFTYEGEFQFYYFKLHRTASREQYKFNILVAPRGFLNLAYIFNSINISASKTKQGILLDYGQGYIDLNEDKHLPEKKLVDQNETISHADFSRVYYNEIIEELDALYFNISNGISEISVQVIGSQIDESITLPTLLDPLRYQSIFTLERIPQYKEASRKVIIAGRERGLNVDIQGLCDTEFKLINNNQLFIDLDKNNHLLIDDIDSNDIQNAYYDLFSWLKNKNTIISLTNWPQELIYLVEKVVNSVLSHFRLIDDGALTESNKNILKIGGYIKDGKEWITPLHPLCLAYCLELINNQIKDDSLSFKEMADVTLQRLNPAGLLPIVSMGLIDYCYSVPHIHNPLWIELVPQKESNFSYIAKLFLEKVEDFISCFSPLFHNDPNKRIIVNSINNKTNKEIFHGVVIYLNKMKEKAHPIHINIYNDELIQTKFDCFSEESDIIRARVLVSSHDANFGQVKNNEQCDDIVSLFREKISFSKFINDNEFKDSHLSFYKNNQSVTLQSAAVDKTKSGILCGGLISGEASYLENGVYYTGYGIKGLKEKNSLIEISSYYNQLYGPSRNNTTKYNKGIISVLAVNENFKIELENCYKKTIWTCIIDPKVTLDFFGTGNTVLIHYSDKYTSSNSYDAITVTEDVDLYKGILEQDSDSVINSFNAINGQWLLNIIRDASSNSVYAKNQTKEKKSIVAAYKFISSVLLYGDIIWIPISISEMLRVARNTGLNFNSSDFSAVFNNYSGGPLSDDLLFVGIKDLSLIILPVEVKAREKGSDASKALKQLQALTRHISLLLTGNTLKSRVLRCLFIQQVLSQVERYKLYGIFPIDYFKQLEEVREILNQGNYPILKIINYYESIVIEFNNSMARVAIDVKEIDDGKTAHITLPLSFFDLLHSKSVENLAIKLNAINNYPSLSSLFIHDSSVNQSELSITINANWVDGDNKFIYHEDDVLINNNLEF